jgi:phage shock protein PspC (stress-responsive transcriptional regulator)
MVAGVAAGLAEYLEVDPVAVRLAFVVLALMGGIAVPLYVVAWLVVPVEGSPNSIAEDVFGQWV